jgi:hypothetical protein
VYNDWRQGFLRELSHCRDKAGQIGSLLRRPFRILPNVRDRNFPSLKRRGGRAINKMDPQNFIRPFGTLIAFRTPEGY